MGHLEQAVVGLVDHYGYFGLFVALMLGNIGAPIGSEIVLPAAGGLTATGHLPNLWLTILVAVAGELAGGTIGYAVGLYGGVPVILKFGKYFHLGQKQLDTIHAFFERWGTFAIFICRFLPVIRGIVGFPAGIAKMNLAHFYLWTLLGSTAFCGGMIWLGYALGDHLDTIMPLVKKGGYGLAAVVVVAVALIILWRARSRGNGQGETSPTGS